MLYEVTKEHGAWPHFQVVDVAVQGLRQSEDELRHAAKSALKGVPSLAEPQPLAVPMDFHEFGARRATRFSHL